MWKDKIVEEVRNLREQYAAQFNFDMDAIFKDIQKRQKSTKRKRNSFPARKPQFAQDVA
jgi:hypothetical protein